jgi:hypothetical protein
LRVRNYVDVSLLIGSSANYAGDGPSRQERSRRLNGISALRSHANYHVATIDEDILRAKFPENDIRVGDEIIKINDMYCESFRNVQSYIENNSIRNITLRNILYGEYLIIEQRNTRNVLESTEDTDFVPMEVVSSEAYENTSRINTVSTKRKRKCIPLNKHKDPISNSE